MSWDVAMRTVRKMQQEARAAFEPIDRLRRPPICEGCGKDRADPPSKLCPGCQAYRDHQR